MIATKHCDVCDTELPPITFVDSYECADVKLHEKHPDQGWSSVRVSAVPCFTNGSGDRRPDLCPACFLKLCEALVARLKKRNQKNATALREWKEWRATSRQV
jgi:hypothetical protein